MKEREKFAKRVKQFYLDYAYAIYILTSIIVGIAIFAIGVIVTWNFVFNPLSDKELRQYDDLAQEVYTSLEDSRIPNDVSIEINSSGIIVKSTNPFRIGKVYAIIVNDKIATINSKEEEKEIMLSFLAGTILAIIYACLVVHFYNHKLEKLLEKERSCSE